MSNRSGIHRGVLWLLVPLLAIGGISLAWLGRSNPPEPIPHDSPPLKPSFPIPPYSESSFLNTSPDTKYIGSGACAECHPNNHKSYLRTPHSQALSDLDPKLEPGDGSFEHKASGRSYRVYRKDGKLHHEEVLRTEEGKEIARVDHPIRYLIGSGHFTRSYIVEVDVFLHESPITWYTSKQKWDMSPGYDHPQHWGFERPIMLGCINCHAGRVEEEGKSAHRLKFTEKAIGCENCHGPGSPHQNRHLTKKHQIDEIDTTIVHPGKVSRAIQESICAACHQSGPATVLLRGRKEGDFRPGQPLSDYVVHYQFSNGSNKMTVVGHTEQLHQSACYQKSTNLTCVTCHDPHQSNEIKDKPAFYRQKCLSCHETQPCKLDAKVRLKMEKDNCMACHMPTSETEIPHIAFTHHRIGRHGNETQAKSVEIPILVPVEDISKLDPIDQKRNLGLAYFEVYRDGLHPHLAGAFQKRALEQLEAVYRAGLKDGATMAALAELYWNAHELSQASLYAQEAITAPDLTAGSRGESLLFLADCDRQDRNFSLAITNLEESVQLRRSANAWRLLGASYLDQNQLQKALTALRASLAIRPYRPTTHLGLADVYRRLGDIPHVKEHLEKAKWLQDHKQD